MLANEVTRCLSERENGTLAKDKKLERKRILEKYSLARDVAWHAEVSEFAFGRLCVTTVHAS